MFRATVSTVSREVALMVAVLRMGQSAERRSLAVGLRPKRCFFPSPEIAEHRCE